MGRWPLLLLTLLLLSQPLWAHAQLTAAEPAAGETLAQSPDQIRLMFNEPVGADSSIVVRTADFAAVEGISKLPSAESELIFDVPPLAEGVYTVEYNAVSADGHTIRGSYEFAVGTRQIGAWLPLIAGLLVGLTVAAFMRYRRRSVAGRHES